MSDVVTDISDARTAYVAAMKTRDYAGARHQCVLALGLIATLPSGQIAGISSQAWKPADIERAVQQLDRLEATADAAGGCGFTTCDVEYTGIRGGGCEC